MAPETIMIDNVKYFKADTIANQSVAPSTDGLEYKIVRTYSAGVFAGYVKNREGKEVTLINARRLWYWSGACSLSQLAIEGTKKPNECKFAMPADVILTEAIEILDVTKLAFESINGVDIWRQK